MKPAKEWEDPAYCYDSPCTSEEHEKFIEEVQSDAYKAGLLRAAEMARKWEHGSYLRAQLVESIEAEAHKEAIKETK